MTPTFRLTHQALQDLDDIWDFIAPDDPLAADGFIDQLLLVMQQLAEAPRIGRQRDDLAPGLRSMPHGNYLVLYKIKHDVVEITRVLHGARDLDALFHPEK